MQVDSRELSLIALFAALYAALVFVFAPVSFYALQFRVAGVIRPAIARKWKLSIGYALGAAIGNLFSPFPGPFELIFMPAMSFVAGLLGYLAALKVSHNYFVAGFVTATVIALSVSWMLNQLFNLPIPATIGYLLISEQAVCFLGATVFKLMERRFKWW